MGCRVVTRANTLRTMERACSKSTKEDSICSLPTQIDQRGLHLCTTSEIEFELILRKFDLYNAMNTACFASSYYFPCASSHRPRR